MRYTGEVCQVTETTGYQSLKTKTRRAVQRQSGLEPASIAEALGNGIMYVCKINGAVLKCLDVCDAYEISSPNNRCALV